MHVRQITEALSLRVKRMRRRLDPIAFWSLIVAVLASIAAAVQAGLLASQVWTPYRTSLYVRQLEVSADFYGAAHEQWAAIIDLNNQCLRPENRSGDTAAFSKLSERFFAGSTRLHDAFSGTIASFPEMLHRQANGIWVDNEYLVEHVVLPSANCEEFVHKFGDLGVFERANAMHGKARRLVDDMRLALRVDRWSRTDIARERIWRDRMRERQRPLKEPWSESGL